MTEDTLSLAELTRFYRDVMLPDFERVIEKAFERFGQHDMRSGYHRALARISRILMTGITIDLDSSPVVSRSSPCDQKSAAFGCGSNDCVRASRPA